MMFEDSEFINDKFVEQNYYFMDFMKKNCKEGITVIEIGAGINVMNIRSLGENLLIKDEYPSCLIRINALKESLVITDMVNRNIITKERYEEFMEGFEIDIEKELEEYSKGMINYIYRQWIWVKWIFEIEVKSICWRKAKKY